MNTLSLIAWLTLLADPLGRGDTTRVLDIAGVERDYMVHIPEKYDPARPTPVVVAFHGGGSHAGQMVYFSGLNAKSEEAGFVVVYPNGSGRLDRLLTFNGGLCCGYAVFNQVDDVAFTRAVLDDLATVVMVDPKRVYATGMSNGAILSYRLASELSDRIAAIASVAGTMGTLRIQAKRPVPVIHFHGTKDEFVPFTGGTGVRSITQAKFTSVQFSIDAWVRHNGCNETPKVVDLPDAADDGMTSKRTTYGSSKEGAEVVLVEISGGGHTWPGRPSRAEFLGPTTKDFQANDLIWEFFERHELK